MMSVIAPNFHHDTMVMLRLSAMFFLLQMQIYSTDGFTMKCWIHDGNVSPTLRVQISKSKQSFRCEAGDTISAADRSRITVSSLTIELWKESTNQFIYSAFCEWRAVNETYRTCGVVLEETFSTVGRVNYVVLVESESNYRKHLTVEVFHASTTKIPVKENNNLLTKSGEAEKGSSPRKPSEENKESSSSVLSLWGTPFYTVLVAVIVVLFVIILLRFRRRIRRAFFRQTSGS